MDDQIRRELIGLAEDRRARKRAEMSTRVGTILSGLVGGVVILGTYFAAIGSGVYPFPGWYGDALRWLWRSMW